VKAERVKKRSPVRIIFPGAETMVRFNEDDTAVGITRELLEIIGKNTAKEVAKAYRRGFTDGHEAASGTSSTLRSGAL
jgi:hypothetical protein